MKRALKALKPGTRFTKPEQGVVLEPEGGGVAVLLTRWISGKKVERRDVWSGYVRVEVEA